MANIRGLRLNLFVMKLGVGESADDHRGVLAVLTYLRSDVAQGHVSAAAHRQAEGSACSGNAARGLC